MEKKASAHNVLATVLGKVQDRFYYDQAKFGDFFSIQQVNYPELLDFTFLWSPHYSGIFYKPDLRGIEYSPELEQAMDWLRLAGMINGDSQNYAIKTVHHNRDRDQRLRTELGDKLFQQAQDLGRKFNLAFGLD